MIKLTVTLADDPIVAAEWIKKFEEQLKSREPTDANTSAEDEELAAEVERFKTNWPAYSGRFSRLHEELVDMGYVPVLAKKMKPTSVRSYIAYALPGGRRVLENNSSTAYFVGKGLRDRLRGTHAWLKEAGDTLSIQFDTDEKVDFILKVAQAEMP